MCEAARRCHSTLNINSTEQCYEPLEAVQAGPLLAAFEHVKPNPSLSSATSRQCEHVTVTL